MRDPASTHHHKVVLAWLKDARAFGCSARRFTAPWMNRVEQGSSRLQRKHSASRTSIPRGPNLGP